MNVAINFDSKEFKAALAQYQAATRKTTAHVINRQMNNWAIKSHDFVKVAMEAAIRSLTSRSWWPKFIAKIAVRRGADRAAKSFAKAKTIKRRAGIVSRFEARAYTRAQAERISRKIINSRMAARLFLRGFFIQWSKSISDKVSGIRSKSKLRKRSYTNIKATYNAATNYNPAASISVMHAYKRKNITGMGKIDMMFLKALTLGRGAAILDMTQYAEKKMKEDAAKHSAKR